MQLGRQTPSNSMHRYNWILNDTQFILDSCSILDAGAGSPEMLSIASGGAPLRIA
jgi:hypothetical protein